MLDDLQTEMLCSPRGYVMALDSAADILSRNRGRDVLVTASYIGVLPARLMRDHLPRAAIGFDGGVGPQGANMAGLWYFEALNVPAAAVDVMTIILGACRTWDRRLQIDRSGPFFTGFLSHSWAMGLQIR